jgi:hypothetical protein
MVGTRLSEKDFCYLGLRVWTGQPVRVMCDDVAAVRIADMQTLFDVVTPFTFLR